MCVAEEDPILVDSPDILAEPEDMESCSNPVTMVEHPNVLGSSVHVNDTGFTQRTTSIPAGMTETFNLLYNIW